MKGEENFWLLHRLKLGLLTLQADTGSISKLPLRQTLGFWLIISPEMVVYGYQLKQKTQGSIYSHFCKITVSKLVKASKIPLFSRKRSYQAAPRVGNPQEEEQGADQLASRQPKSQLRGPNEEPLWSSAQTARPKSLRYLVFLIPKMVLATSPKTFQSGGHNWPQRSTNGHLTKTIQSGGHTRPQLATAGH